MVANSAECAMLLEGPGLFLGFASVASGMAALRVMAEIRAFRLEPAHRPGVFSMSRTEITPIAGLSREGEREASTDVKPLPWLHCALLILLTSALCYGLGYFVIAELLWGRL
jgi:hypothetical protein